MTRKDFLLHNRGKKISLILILMVCTELELWLLWPKWTKVTTTISTAVTRRQQHHSRMSAITTFCSRSQENSAFSRNRPDSAEAKSKGAQLPSFNANKGKVMK